MKKPAPPKPKTKKKSPPAAKAKPKAAPAAKKKPTALERIGTLFRRVTGAGKK
jgi:hypothetical protein